MRGITIFLTIVSVAVGQAGTREKWHLWKERHMKVYLNESEEASRKQIWLRNLLKISDHNSRNLTFVMELNQFADLSEEELSALLLTPMDLNNGGEGCGLHVNSNKNNYPSSLDWRERGFVTKVKDQGKCKSSWAFSAIGALEGQNFKESGHLLDLSVQQAIDCSWLHGNRGCHGGLATSVFDYVNREHGICASSSYSYVGYMWHCMESYCKKVAYCSGCRRVESGSETDLLDALYTIGPISISIDASSYSFKYYHGGVYVEESCSTKKLNLALLLVGYGSYGGQDYWIVKNRYVATTSV
jgi:C1A family cysteine protease